MAGAQTHAAFIHRHTLHLAANTCNPDCQRRKQGGPELRAGFGYLASEASLPCKEKPVQYSTKQKQCWPGEKEEGQVPRVEVCERIELFFVMIDLKKHEVYLL